MDGRALFILIKTREDECCMTYRKVPTDMDFAGREQEVLDFWRGHEIFHQCQRLRDGAPKFTFYDGPPTANGKPHIGHVLTLSLIHI